MPAHRAFNLALVAIATLLLSWVVVLAAFDPPDLPPTRVVVAGTQPLAVTISWAPGNNDPVDGFRVHWGTAAGVYTSTVDVGRVTQFTTPPLDPGAYYFMVTAYFGAIESDPSPILPVPVVSSVDCSAFLGAQAVSVFITKKITTTGVVGSREGLTYQLASPGSAIVNIQPTLNGQPAGPGLQGVNLTADGGIWFPTPMTPGPYALALVVTNAAGCSTTATTDAAGHPLVTIVNPPK